MVVTNHSLPAYLRKPIQSTNELSDVTHHPNIGTSAKFDFLHHWPLRDLGSFKVRKSRQEKCI